MTNATQEFVMLLHVSSFSPSSTPRSYSPYSPMLASAGAAAQSAALAALTVNGSSDDRQLGASLSRSRTAQPSASLKLVTPAMNSAPRSALPNQQTFRIPAVGGLPVSRGVNGTSKLRNGDLDSSIT